MNVNEILIVLQDLLLVASRWCDDSISLLASKGVLGRTLIKHVTFWKDWTIYKEVLSSRFHGEKIFSRTLCFSPKIKGCFIIVILVNSPIHNALSRR